jgi:hypothetical protein
MSFTKFSKNISDSYKELSKRNNFLFLVDIDGYQAWQVYLDAFTDDDYRQEYNCNCCKSFIKRYAGIVAIEDNVIKTLWDNTHGLSEEFKNVAKAMNAFIKAQEIKSVFFTPHSSLGYASTYDHKNDVTWDHFSLDVASSQIRRNAAEAMRDSREQKLMFEKAESELGYSVKSVDKVLALIEANDLYRATATTKGTMELLKSALLDISKLNNKEMAYWRYCMEKDITRIKNTSLGVLLTSLSKGEDLEKAVGKYNAVVDPSKYKRSKGKVTSLTLKKLKTALEEAGYMPSLKRCHISPTDIPVNQKLFSCQKANDSKVDFFEEMEKDVTVSPLKLNKSASKISIENFITDVLPNASNLKLVHEAKHLPNLVSVIGPQVSNAPSIFQWNNSMSWTYADGVADAITTRVKKAGGKVDAVLRVSLVWENRDDLDLYLTLPNKKVIFHGNPSMSGANAHLDVDENYTRVIDNPAENIYLNNHAFIKKHMGEVYEVKIHNFQTRTRVSSKQYTIQIAYKNQIVNIPSSVYPEDGNFENLVTFKIDPEKGLVLPPSLSHLLESDVDQASETRWGVSTNRLVDVNMITVSPNYWDSNKVGNKHYIMSLEGCKSDEDMLPFFNEQLSGELREYRKALEMLSEKAKVTPSDIQVSGLGFSETKKANFLMQVQCKEGTKRMYNVSIANS